MEKFEKRVARSPPILDLDDYLILKFLDKTREKASLNAIKQKMNLSHNALLIHLGRLEDHGWIKISRREENYKFKDVDINLEGKELFKILKKGMSKKADKFRELIAKIGEKEKGNKPISKQFLSKLKKNRIK